MITLVADDERSGTELAGYLRRSGFDVRLHDRTLRASHAACSIVWLTDGDGDASAAAQTVDAWLGASEGRSAVVITWRPAAFRAVHEVRGLRLIVLPAPVFGWQVVDALRDTRVGGGA